MRVLKKLLGLGWLGLAAVGCAAGDPLDSPEVEQAEESITLLPGFQNEIIATGLSQPTAMAIAPDGRIFVTQQTGQIKVIKNKALLPTSFVELTVDSVNERGLVGIALDPNFASNHYIYVFYTTPSGGTHNRVSRFTANGDVAQAGSEFILVDFPALSAAGNHNSGALNFSNDGKLFVDHGDNANDANAQDLNHPFGSILRFNPDGSIPTDNPFYNTSTGLARAIWAYGVRNSFTAAVQRSTGKLFANDVGGGGPEEINNIVKGANYGHGGGPAPVPPVYSYPRDAGRCAIAGGTFYESPVANFPTSYQGKYFFSDYCSGQIWSMNSDGSGVALFATNSNGELNNPVDLDVGLDGSLYYLQRGSGAKVGRIYNPQPPCSSDAQCSDGNACTGVERCVGNVCQNGTPLTCDDGNACTTNTCIPATGCSYPDNGLCCSGDAECNDGSSCTNDACVGGFCQNTDNGSCNQCVKIRSQRTNDYLVLDAAKKVVPGSSQTNATIFEMVPAGAGFKFKNAGNFMRVVTNDLTVDTSETSAVAFTQYDCSSGGTYPGGKGYASPTGTAPHWKATTTNGPIKSGDGGNGASCVDGSASSWERFYPEVVTCPGGGPTPVCGDGTCNGTETCSSCAADCGACSSCGDGQCNGSETCSTCASDCGPCSSTGCFKIRSQRTNGYLIKDATNQVVPTGSQTTAVVFEKVASGSGFKFKNSAGSYVRLVNDNLTLDATDATAVAFNEHDCTGGGAYPMGMGYSSPSGTAPHWKATTAAGPIQSGNAGNGTVCDGADGTSWERFYMEPATCGGSSPVCGDGSCNGSETCSSCAADCGTCAAVCGDGSCNGSETCSSCAADCGTCAAVCGDGSCNGSETCSSCPADCGSCGSVTRYEAEASVYVNSALAGEGGSSGGQYVDGNQGANLTWGVSSSGGNATLGFAIRAPSGVRVMGVFVNGSKVGTVTTSTLRPTWAVHSVSATLIAGSNSIELRDSEGQAEPDIDYLEVTGSGGGPYCGDGSCNGTETCNTCAADCGACPATCGDGSCNGSETCSSCAADCGSCSATPAKLTLTTVTSSGGWTDLAGLTDGNLTAKVSTPTSPNCVEYSLGGAYTLTSARLLEDNAGAWNVGTWKVQYDNGGGFTDAFAYTNTPSAMPTWNDVDFSDVSGVTRVNVCMQNPGGPIEAAEIEVWGFNAPAPVCGDWLCDASEDCGSCPWDCDSCAGAQLGLDNRPANPDCVAGNSTDDPPFLLSDHPCVTSVSNPPQFSSGMIPYSIAETFWSDSAYKTRLLALPDGEAFNVQSDGDFLLPAGAVTIKNFQWAGAYFETRFFVRYDDGSYGAYTYMWNDTQDEAFLVDPVAGDSKVLAGGHTWNYPTETECFGCHTSAAGFSLGLETRQLNVNQLYASTGRTANQFDTLNAIGMLDGNTGSLPPFPGHAQTSASLQMRAEAYLHVNCSNCHRPGGPGYGTADYRYDTTFANMNICNRQSILSAFPDMDLVEPGAHESSVVWLRMSQRTADFMPPIASTIADAEGAALLQEWIDSLTGCP